MKLINLTPHTVRVVPPEHDGSPIEVPPSGDIARVAVTPGRWVASHQRIPVHAAPTYGEVEGLPAAGADDLGAPWYIVSIVVASHPAVRGRTDVMYPDSGPDAIRRDGQIWGVRRLLRAPTE